MARPKKVSPDTTTKEAASVGSEESNVLASLTHTLAVAGFDQKHDLKVSEPGMAAAMVWGRHEGVETARVLALVLPPGAWNRSNADDVAALSWTLPPSDTAADHYPQFAVVKDAEGKLEAVFDVTPGDCLKFRVRAITSGPKEAPHGTTQTPQHSGCAA